jgi:hypothetical protein
MDVTRLPAILLILGTALTYIGFSVFPPRIFTLKVIQEKMDLLAARPQLWTASQSSVILGALASTAGALYLSPIFNDTLGALPVTIAAVGFALGHVFWIWHLGLRIAAPQKFAKNELPGWLGMAYAVLVLLALAAFGAAFWLQGTNPLLGAGIFLGAVLVLGLYLKVKDMPPFIYYAMTLAIGVTLLFG